MELAAVSDQISNFYSHSFFTIVGGLGVTLGFLAFFYRFVFWVLGISPIVFHLGMAIWKRKIAIFADSESFTSLSATLKDSRLFKNKNILHIPLNNIEKANEETLFLVDWEIFHQKIEEIFSARKSDQTAIIIFAKPGSIPIDQMALIANRPNTVVVNFRGRLLNDVFTSLITTRHKVI